MTDLHLSWIDFCFSLFRKEIYAENLGEHNIQIICQSVPRLSLVQQDCGREGNVSHKHSAACVTEFSSVRGAHAEWVSL